MTEICLLRAAASLAMAGLLASAGPAQAQSLKPWREALINPDIRKEALARIGR
jgi:hypothetical protein